jgi:hypothetical protein
VLIDLWARMPGDENVYSDITWTGYVGKDVPAEMRRVYDLVNTGRDASLKAAQDGWKAGRKVQGWELDEAARKVFIDAGMGQYVKHRTGHSLSPGPKVHGLGFNLDNLETRDTRVMPADLRGSQRDQRARRSRGRAGGDEQDPARAHLDRLSGIGRGPAGSRAERTRFQRSDPHEPGTAGVDRVPGLAERRLENCSRAQGACVDE